MSEQVYAGTDFDSKWNATVSNLSILAKFLLKDSEHCGEDFLKMGDQFMKIPLEYAQGAFASFTFLVSKSRLIGDVSEHIAVAARINYVFMEHRDEFFTVGEGYGLLMRRDAWWTYVLAIPQLLPLFPEHVEKSIKQSFVSEELLSAINQILPKDWVQQTGNIEGSVVKLVSIGNPKKEAQKEANHPKALH